MAAQKTQPGWICPRCKAKKRGRDKTCRICSPVSLAAARIRRYCFGLRDGLSAAYAPSVWSDGPPGYPTAFKATIDSGPSKNALELDVLMQLAKYLGVPLLFIQACAYTYAEPTQSVSTEDLLDLLELTDDGFTRSARSAPNLEAAYILGVFHALEATEAVGLELDASDLRISLLASQLEIPVAFVHMMLNEAAGRIFGVVNTLKMFTWIQEKQLDLRLLELPAVEG